MYFTSFICFYTPDDIYSAEQLSLSKNRLDNLYEKEFSASSAHDLIMAENLDNVKDGKFFEASSNRQTTPDYNFIRYFMTK